MTIPEPVLIVQAIALAGLVAGVVLAVRRKLRTLGALLFGVAVAHIAGGVYALLPLCSSSQVLAGGKVLRCFGWTWSPLIAGMGALSVLGGAIALWELRRTPRMLALALATVLMLPISLMLVYGMTFVLLCVTTVLARYLVPQNETAQAKPV